MRRLEAFEILKLAAYSKVRSIEEEVSAEVEARFELHRARLGDINVERLLRTGTLGPSGTASSQASASWRPFQYKPQEAFLGSKKFLWWKSGDTTAAPDDLEKLLDYLYSGGTFTLMYLKKCMCKDTLISYRTALNKKLEKRADPMIDLLIQTLKEVILFRIPRKLRLTQMFERALSVGKMGKGGANVDSSPTSYSLRWRFASGRP